MCFPFIRICVFLFDPAINVVNFKVICDFRPYKRKNNSHLSSKYNILPVYCSGNSEWMREWLQQWHRVTCVNILEPVGKGCFFFFPNLHTDVPLHQHQKHLLLKKKTTQKTVHSETPGSIMTQFWLAW